MLPPKVEVFLNYPIIRIFRVIGGLSVLLVLSKQFNNFIFPLNYLIVIFCALQIIQVITISIIKIYYGINKLIYHKKDFEVRNSPLNVYASALGKILYCAKMGCLVTGGTASIVAGGASFDLVLEAAGREKVFIPFLGNLYKSAFGEVPANFNKNLNTMISSTVPKNDPEFTNLITEFDRLNLTNKVKFVEEIKKSIDKEGNP